MLIGGIEINDVVVIASIELFDGFDGSTICGHYLAVWVFGSGRSFFLGERTEVGVVRAYDVHGLEDVGHFGGVVRLLFWWSVVSKKGE